MKSVWGGLLFAGFTLLTACAAQKVFQATGGNRAAGTVDVSFQYGVREKPRYNTRQALDVALSQCKSWGYSSAEQFGGRKARCERGGGRQGCELTTVTIPYKCTGGAPTR